LGISFGTTAMVLAPALAGGWIGWRAFAAEALPHLMISHVTLAAIGLVLLRLRLPRGAPAMLLPIVAWILPALSADTGAAAALWNLVSPSRDPGPSAPAPRIGGAFALLAASLLADLRPERR